MNSLSSFEQADNNNIEATVESGLAPISVGMPPIEPNLLESPVVPKEDPNALFIRKVEVVAKGEDPEGANNAYLRRLNNPNDARTWDSILDDSL